jgi:protein TonB
MKLRLAASLFALIGCLCWAAPQEAAPQRIRVSDDVMRAVLVRKVTPVYPPLARQARIQGAVILKVVIDKSGNVFSVQLVSGHPMLAPAAIEAVKQWKYQPYLLNGEAVEVETNVQVIFRIDGEPAPAGPDEGAPGTGPGEVPGGIPGATPGQNVRLGVIGGVIAPATPGDSGHPALPKRIRVSSAVAQALLERKVSPTYPPDARQQHVQGVVVLKVETDKEGNVYDVELISGHPLLAPAAMEAVKQWKYRPFLLNGTPVEVETQVQVNFTLTQN